MFSMFFELTASSRTHNRNVDRVNFVKFTSHVNSDIYWKYRWNLTFQTATLRFCFVFRTWYMVERKTYMLFTRCGLSAFYSQLRGFEILLPFLLKCWFCRFTKSATTTAFKYKKSFDCYKYKKQNIYISPVCSPSGNAYFL